MLTSDSQLIHRRLFIVLLIAYTTLFLTLFFYGVFSFPVKNYLPTFRAQWTLNITAIRFLSILTTVHSTVIVLTISFSARSTYTGSLNRSIGGAMVVFLVFTLVYTVFVEGVEPASLRRIERLRYQTRVARVIYDKAKTAYDDGRFEESWGLLEYYREVDPGNEEAAELFSFVTKRLSDSLGDRENIEESISRSARRAEQSPAALIALANKYLDEEDVFSAYYYAQLAKEIALQNGETWQRADRVSAVAATAIDALELSENEVERADLYSTKQRGIEALSSSNPERMIEGYYIFKMLSLIYPDDVEVERYFGIASTATTEITFFLDEAKTIIPMPGHRNIVFINTPADSRIHELIKLGKIVNLNSSIYVEDIEVMGIHDTGALVYHYQTPYAELLGGVLLLRGIDRKDPSVFTAPIVYEGSDQAINRSMLALRPSIEQLLSLSSTQTDYRDRGFFQLMELVKILPDYGYNPTPARSTALDRVTAPFTFFILSLFSVAIAIRFAPDRGRPPVLTYLLIPVVPVVVFGLIELYRFGMKIFTTFLSLEVSFNLSLFYVIGGQLVLLIVAIFFLAATHAKIKE